MSSNFGSLGEFFPSKEIKCRIRGCSNNVVLDGEQAIRQKVSGHGDSRGGGQMCASCYSLFLTLKDQELPCSHPGCEGTWTWNRFMQLEHHAKGYKEKPKGLCPKCRGELRQGVDIEKPCRIKGCKNTWTWTRRMQMEAKDGEVPRRMCNECHEMSKKLKEVEANCRIRGCENKISWSVTAQLEYWRSSGKSIDKLPGRMCPECLKRYGQFKPVEVPCRLKDCKNTWTWSPLDQTEAALKAGEGKAAVPPARLCKTCMDFFNHAQDKEVECCNKGCGNKWLWTRGMQTAAKVRGFEQPPRLMCDDCKAKLQALSDQEKPCSVMGCKGTYTFTAKEQLKFQLSGSKPTGRKCKACTDFLANGQPETLVCGKCGREFQWSVGEQLATSLGVWEKPVNCAECTSREISEVIPEEKMEMITRPEPKPLTVNIPLNGDWNDNSVIRDWPGHMTRESIDKMENSSCRIVCIGDQNTSGNANFGDTWCGMLEGMLNGQPNGGVLLRPEKAVLNVGIDGCTTRLACRRFLRDVKPFAPQYVVFSFALADVLNYRTAPTTPEDVAAALKSLEGDFLEFVELCRGLESKPKVICWLPNPVFPQVGGDHSGWKANLTPDEAVVRFYDANLRQLNALCKDKAVTVVDARALFMCAGMKAAQGYLANWWQANADGCRNIASWIREAID